MPYSRQLGMLPCCKFKVCRYLIIWWCVCVRLCWTTASPRMWRLAPSISSMMLSIWDVSAEALESGDLDGLFNLSLLTAVIKTSPVLLLFMLPQSRNQLHDMAANLNVFGGAVFLMILFGSMCYIIFVGILNIVHPGWAGASWILSSTWDILGVEALKAGDSDEHFNWSLWPQRSVQ